jgi:hypothetical protein
MSYQYTWLLLIIDEHDGLSPIFKVIGAEPAQRIAAYRIAGDGLQRRFAVFSLV